MLNERIVIVLSEMPNICTANNATDLLQVISFIGLLQLVEKVAANLSISSVTQVCCNMSFVDLLQLLKHLAVSLWIMINL